MIGRIKQRMAKPEEVVEPKGFDDFELRLGDMMRGERATMGKSLLDVQRELRIKASYIAAIENSDPSVFDTPGFIAGYVRSYARYLGMDPDEAFGIFCEESGFIVAHGMSAEASGRRKSDEAVLAAPVSNDPFASPNTPFAPVNEGIFSQFEPRAIGSSLVLLALICGIGYGGWSVLKEVQQVQFAPVEQTPVVLADLDPLDSAAQSADGERETRTTEALDRLYRPQALDVPVLVARDAPISTLDPSRVGSFQAPSLPQVEFASAEEPDALRSAVNEAIAQAIPQVLEEVAPNLVMVAVRPSWVRVRAADGTVIFEGIMERGQSYEVPLTEEPPTLRAGESSAIYFAMNGAHYGPVGNRGEVTKNLSLTLDGLGERYEVADLNAAAHIELAKVVAEAQVLQSGN
jgi:cytoskeletal protein RodZ